MRIFIHETKLCYQCYFLSNPKHREIISPTSHLACSSKSILIQLARKVYGVYGILCYESEIKMKLRPENKCKFCCKLFCCQECRIKHEVSVHFTLFCEVINCDLCNGEEKIVFRNGHTNEFIDHLFRFHLPLHCRNCSVVFQNKVDLAAVHTCVSSELIENEKLGSKMAFEGEGKIEPIIEEELEQDKVTEVSCV